MSIRSPRVLALTLLLALAALTPAPAAADWSGAQIAAWAAGPERAWARMTEVDGAIPDRLEPAYGAFNYGTLMLAQAQLRAAARGGDDELQRSAVAQILGTLRRDPQSDPFHVLAATTLLRDGQAGRLPASAWARIEQPLSDWIGRIAPFRRRVFGSVAGYDNWRLVFAAGAAELARSGLRGSAGGIASDPAALRAEVRRIISRLMPRNAGPRLRVRGWGRRGHCPIRRGSRPPTTSSARCCWSASTSRRRRRSAAPPCGSVARPAATRSR